MRKGGIEILRLLAMLFVVTLHVLGSGGIISNMSKGTGSYWIIWLIEIIAYASLNVFGIISGYVMYDKQMTVTKVGLFYGRVFFYTIAIWGATRIIGLHDTTLSTMFSKSLLHNTGLWYVNSYLLLMILMPVLNAFIEKSGKQDLLNYMRILFLATTVIPFLIGRDLWNMNGGYSVLWLAILYLLGGGISKCGVDRMVPRIKWIGYYVVCVTLLFGSKMLMEVTRASRGDTYEEYNILITYVSPLMLMTSICLFCVFSTMSPLLPKWFYKVARASFGVYLVHMHYFLFAHLVTNRFVVFLNGSAISMLVNVCLGIIIIFVCSLLAGIVLEFFYIMLCKLLKKLVGQIRKKKACT